MNETTNKSKVSKKGLLGIGVLAILVIAFLAIYSVFGAKGVAGEKSITIEVINKAQESIVYEVSTDAEYLRGAMDEAEGLTYDGEEGPYGLTISAINGEVADFNVDSAYWSFYVNGEYCNYGIDAQPVMDGDEFQIVYTVME